MKRLNNEQKRKKANLIKIEGLRLLENSLKQDWFPELITTEKHLKNLKFKNLKKIFISEEKIIKKYMNLPKLEPIIAIGEYPVKKNVDYNENIVAFFSQDPTNIGSIIRTSLAHGINNFLFSKNSPDPYNLLVLRTSAGFSFGIKNSKINIDESPKLSNHKLIVASAHDGIKIENLKSKNKKFCLVFGHESKGVPKPWEEKGEKITIPIKNIESLSVSAAAAIIINKITK